MNKCGWSLDQRHTRLLPARLLDCLRPLGPTTAVSNQRRSISTAIWLGFLRRQIPEVSAFEPSVACDSRPPILRSPTVDPIHSGILVHGHGSPCPRCWRGLPCALRAPSMGCVTVPSKRYALERVKLGQPRLHCRGHNTIHLPPPPQTPTPRYISSSLDL